MRGVKVRAKRPVEAQNTKTMKVDGLPLKMRGLGILRGSMEHCLKTNKYIMVN